jgi:hypothetical protein
MDYGVDQDIASGFGWLNFLFLQTGGSAGAMWNSQFPI